MSERDPDFDAIKEEDIFNEAAARRKMSLDFTSDNRKMAKASLLFREGQNHWDNNFVTSVSVEQPELVINFTDTLVTRVVNSISDLETRGKAHPIAEAAEEETSETING